MHKIEPYWKWRGKYIAEEDSRSPFYGKFPNELQYTQTVYNYYIHPHWSDFGSNTLYLKVLFVDYKEKFAIIEFIGEWNDCIDNDIMYLKRDVIDSMLSEGIIKFVLIGENVLNFHGSDNEYYKEWHENISDDGGWVIGIGFRQHVLEEMYKAELHHFIFMHERFLDIPWRNYRPQHLVELLENLLIKRLV
ncbi:MAG: hypothetical protein LC105_11310 [Chitinophagales bacterium]|nr:hypothetical protein [Chitinophagales bacterium]